MNSLQTNSLQTNSNPQINHIDKISEEECYDKLISVNGLDHQLDRIVEEAAELIQAVQKYKRYGLPGVPGAPGNIPDLKPDLKYHLIEEMGDTINAISSTLKALGTSSQLLDIIRIQKLQTYCSKHIKDDNETNKILC